MASKNGIVKTIHRLHRNLRNLWMVCGYFSSNLRPALRLSQFMIALKIRK